MKDPACEPQALGKNRGAVPSLLPTWPVFKVLTLPRDAITPRKKTLTNWEKGDLFHQIPHPETAWKMCRKTQHSAPNRI